MPIDPTLKARIEALRSSGREAIQSSDRLAHLKDKLSAREGKPGYSANIEAIKAEIAALEGAPE